MDELSNLPAIAAFTAEDKSGHGLVGRAGLDLSVGAVLLLTLATLEHIRRRPALHSHLQALLTTKIHHKINQYPR